MNRQDLHERAAQLRQRQQEIPCRVLVCCSSPCLAAGAGEVRAALQAEAAGHPGVSVEITATGCLGPCSRGPLVTVCRPGAADAVYERVTPELARTILAGHMGQAPISEHRLPETFPFLARQTRIVLENCGRIDPENLDHYLAADGYAALARALNDFTPEEVCEAVVQSGLREIGRASCRERV